MAASIFSSAAGSRISLTSVMKSLPAVMSAPMSGTPPLVSMIKTPRMSCARDHGHFLARLYTVEEPFIGSQAVEPELCRRIGPEGKAARHIVVHHDKAGVGIERIALCGGSGN